MPRNDPYLKFWRFSMWTIFLGNTLLLLQFGFYSANYRYQLCVCLLFSQSQIIRTTCHCLHQDHSLTEFTIDSWFAFSDPNRVDSYETEKKLSDQHCVLLQQYFLFFCWRRTQWWSKSFSCISYLLSVGLIMWTSCLGNCSSVSSIISQPVIVFCPNGRSFTANSAFSTLPSSQPSFSYLHTVHLS